MAGASGRPWRSRANGCPGLDVGWTRRRNRPVASACHISSSPRMSAAIDLEQTFAIDGGVDLRRRQGGMPEQLLDRAQIAAAREQMGGEGMAQRMRRRGLRQG